MHETHSEHFDGYAYYTHEEIDKIVEHIRLDLYNRGVLCGATAIARQMRRERIRPIPSIRTIGRILARRCLTYGQTGYYEEEHQKF